MEDVIALLVADAQAQRAEIESLHAEVGALRLLLGASLVGGAGPLNYLEKVAANVDNFTLPISMTERQRDIVRERIEGTLAIIQVQQRTSFPGGWRGVKYWSSWRTQAFRRIFLGAV